MRSHSLLAWLPNLKLPSTPILNQLLKSHTNGAVTATSRQDRTEKIREDEKRKEKCIGMFHSLQTLAHTHFMLGPDGPGASYARTIMSGPCQATREDT